AWRPAPSRGPGRRQRRRAPRPSLRADERRSRVPAAESADRGTFAFRSPPLLISEPFPQSMHLPPGPTQPPIVQTLHWLLRPISFLESCRRRFGDAFSVSFLGFQTPMVMLSDPEAIRALYTVPGHTLPPGRTVALQPIMGSRSLLLLEGREHLARRKLMLPPFHGARMRAYEATVREVVAREVSTWPSDEPFALHPRMQAITLEVILQAVFGVTDSADRARLAPRL